MNQGKSMLIDKTSILSQNLGHYQKLKTFEITSENIFSIWKIFRSPYAEWKDFISPMNTIIPGNRIIIIFQNW